MKQQEAGLRVTLLTIEDVPGKKQIRFTVVAEEIIGNEENRDPYEWFGNIYYGSGKLLGLFQCGVEKIAENKWHANYCEKFDVLPAELYKDKTYFVFTKRLNDDLERKFARDIDKEKDTIILQIDLKNKFLGQRQK